MDKPERKADLMIQPNHLPQMYVWFTDNRILYSFEVWELACELKYDSTTLYHRRFIDQEWSDWRGSFNEIIDALIEYELLG